MNKNKMIFPALCAAAILLLGGCSQASARNADAMQASGGQMISAVSVETAVIEKTSIAETLTYNGVVNYADVYHVTPEISGKVEAVYFDVGQQVNAGDVLLLIDDTDIRTQIQSLQTTISNADISIQSANIKVSEDEMKLQQTQNTLTKTQQLFDAGAASQSELDTASDNCESAQRTLESSRISVSSAQTSLNSTRIQLQSAQTELAATKVKSPIAGIVSAKNVELGMVSGSSAAYTIVRTDKMSAEVGITEQLASIVAAGDTVSVAFSSLAGETFSGELVSVSPVTDESGTYPVKISIYNESQRMKAGMSCEIRFTKTANNAAFVVPKDAVLADENGSFVYTAADGKAHKTVVETGIDDGANIEITSGLSEGDVVIVKGQNYVTDQGPVNDINDPSDDAPSSSSGGAVTDGSQRPDRSGDGPPAGEGMQGPPSGGGGGGGPGMGF